MPLENAITNESQIEALRYAVSLTQPQGVLETGMVKSMFGYVLSHMVDGVTLYTLIRFMCMTPGGSSICAMGKHNMLRNQ
jgi:hypothetical protein